MEKLMRADQMQRAAKTIVALLDHSDILDIIRQCRGAVSDKKHASLAKLGHAGAVLMESTERLDGSALLVLKQLHLESLTSPGYWRNLLADTTDEKTRQSELVRLYSRVMFANSHLPSLLNLMSTVSNDSCASVAEGEQILTIKLTDAGEKASDPDRLARAIDGIDMLYSACASLAKKPAMDLQLINVTGQSDRDINFLGDNEAIQAVKTIIESIPDAIVDIDPEEEIDIQHLVQSLPVFDDLKVLQKLGTYTPSDLQDIRDTMHQGVLLSLESGVVLVYAENEERAATVEPPSERSGSVVKAVPSLPVLHAAPKSDPQSSAPASSAATPNQNIASVNEKLAQDKLAEVKRAQVKLAQVKLAKEKLASEKLASDKQASEKQANEKLAGARPISEKPSNIEPKGNLQSGPKSGPKSGPGVEKDEFYDQYLKERERLQSGVESHDVHEDAVADKRDNAINNLLRGLKK